MFGLEKADIRCTDCDPGMSDNPMARCAARGEVTEGRKDMGREDWNVDRRGLLLRLSGEIRFMEGRGANPQADMLAAREPVRCSTSGVMCDAWFAGEL